MASEIVVAELTELASEINAEHAQADKSARKAVGHARRCGELLLAAKEKIGHGGFLAWLKDNCAVGERQAQNYMRVARNLVGKSEPGADLTIKEAARIADDHQSNSMPDLSQSHTLRCLGDSGQVAIVIPVGGNYFYVGVVDDESVVTEISRGVRGDAVSKVLEAAGFTAAGSWDRRPLSGDDLQYVAKARSHWHQRQARGDWSKEA
jgi:rhodanese-related sulfurtransferase